MSREANDDEFVTFDDCMEVVADTSVLELTTDARHALPPTVPARATPRPADGKVQGGGGGGEDGGGRCRAMWRRVYGLLSSSVGLVLLLVAYTLLGAAVLYHTERGRERQMHAELDDVRRRVVADIINVTAASRDRRSVRRSRDYSSGDVTLADAVDALVVEYGDARESLRPISNSPGWTFSGALYFCGTVYTTIGQC